MTFLVKFSEKFWSKFSKTIDCSHLFFFENLTTIEFFFENFEKKVDFRQIFEKVIDFRPNLKCWKISILVKFSEISILVQICEQLRLFRNFRKISIFRLNFRKNSDFSPNFGKISFFSEISKKIYYSEIFEKNRFGPNFIIISIKQQKFNFNPNFRTISIFFENFNLSQIFEKKINFGPFFEKCPFIVNFEKFRFQSNFQKNIWIFGRNFFLISLLRKFWTNSIE